MSNSGRRLLKRKQAPNVTTNFKKLRSGSRNRHLLNSNQLSTLVSNSNIDEKLTESTCIEEVVILNDSDHSSNESKAKKYQKYNLKSCSVVLERLTNESQKNSLIGKKSTYSDRPDASDKKERLSKINAKKFIDKVVRSITIEDEDESFPVKEAVKEYTPKEAVKVYTPKKAVKVYTPKKKVKVYTPKEKPRRVLRLPRERHEYRRRYTRKEAVKVYTPKEKPRRVLRLPRERHEYRRRYKKNNTLHSSKNVKDCSEKSNEDIYIDNMIMKNVCIVTEKNNKKVVNIVSIPEEISTTFDLIGNRENSERQQADDENVFNNSDQNQLLSSTNVKGKKKIRKPKHKNKSYEGFCIKCNEVHKMYSGLLSECPTCQSVLVYNCVFYNKEYEHMTDINMDVQQKHELIPEEKRTCKRCEAIFEGPGSLVKHLENCQLKGFLNCKFCDYINKVKDHFKMHMYNCHKDQASQKEMDKLIAEIVEKAKNVPENKPKTGNKSKAEKVFKTHLRQYQNQMQVHCKHCDIVLIGERVERELSCPQCQCLVDIKCLRCDARYQDWSHIIEHLKNECIAASVEVYWLKCNDCDFKTSNKRRMRKHIGEKHMKSYNECSNCGKMMSNRGLRRHKKWCGIRPMLMCKYCNYSTHRVTNLWYHNKREHQLEDGLPSIKHKTKSVRVAEDWKINWKLANKGKTKVNTNTFNGTNNEQSIKSIRSTSNAIGNEIATKSASCISNAINNETVTENFNVTINGMNNKESINSEITMKNITSNGIINEKTIGSTKGSKKGSTNGTSNVKQNRTSTKYVHATFNKTKNKKTTKYTNRTSDAVNNLIITENVNGHLNEMNNEKTVRTVSNAPKEMNNGIIRVANRSILKGATNSNCIILVSEDGRVIKTLKIAENTNGISNKINNVNSQQHPIKVFRPMYVINHANGIPNQINNRNDGQRTIKVTNSFEATKNTGSTLNKINNGNSQQSNILVTSASEAIKNTDSILNGISNKNVQQRCGELYTDYNNFNIHAKKCREKEDKKIVYSDTQKSKLSCDFLNELMFRCESCGQLYTDYNEFKVHTLKCKRQRDEKIVSFVVPKFEELDIKDEIIFE